MVIARHILANWRNRRRFTGGKFEASTGSTHRALDLAGSLAYIDRVFEDYLRYGELAESDLAGLSVIEIGPGDNLGVALRFLAAGAAHVVCLDKFYSDRDIEQQTRIYRALRDRLDEAGRRRFDEAVQFDGGLRFNEQRLRYVYGVSAEQADTVLQREGFDLIVSRAVIQDIYDPEAALVALDRLLKPGGMILHKIDLHDYGVFPRGQWHPLTFLTVGDTIYRLMTSDSAAPNRRTIAEYRRIMQRLNCDATLLITGIIGRSGELVPHKAAVEPGVDYTQVTVDLIEAIRPRLLPRFRTLPVEELMVAGVFLVGNKKVPG